VPAVVRAAQQRRADRGEDAWFVATEVVVEDQVECLPRLRLVFLVPLKVVPTSTAGDLLRGQDDEEEVILAGLLSHLDGGPIAGPE
jgi:hypothetical protein